MIPFDCTMPHIAWFAVWRGHIAKAKEHQGNNDGYCRAAVIAQAQYVMFLAFELARYSK